jgi:hypothetical protein
MLAVLLSVSLCAQQPLPSDTLKRKPDSTGVVPATQPAQPAQTMQEQSAPKKVRRDTRPLKDRIDFDVNTSFWATSSQATGEFMVLVSYRFPKILSVGAGPTYIYNYNRTAGASLNGWGGKVFARAQLIKFLYLWTEYQGISNQYISDYNPVTRSKSYSDSWFFGAGLNFFGINLSVMYDLLHDSRSPYAGATIYRIGYSF